MFERFCEESSLTEGSTVKTQYMCLYIPPSLFHVYIGKGNSVRMVCSVVHLDSLFPEKHLSEAFASQTAIRCFDTT